MFDIIHLAKNKETLKPNHLPPTNRQLKQNLSPDEKPLRKPPSAIPATKTFCNSDFHNREGSPERIYENIPLTRTEKESVLYENVKEWRWSLPTSTPSPQLSPSPPPPIRDDEPDRKDDVVETQVNLPEDCVTTSEASTVWLSESWKYNTIKKAPEFNIFEFSDIDLDKEQTDDNNINTKVDDTENNVKGVLESQRENMVQKGRKKLRSRLPLFGWKNGKENKSQDGKVIKTLQSSDQVLKPDNKWTQKIPGVLRKPVGMHKSIINTPFSDHASRYVENSPKKENSHHRPSQDLRGELPSQKQNRQNDNKSLIWKSNSGSSQTLVYSSSSSSSPSATSSPSLVRSPVKARYHTRTTMGLCEPTVAGGTEWGGGGKHKHGDVSSLELPSCVSPLISPGSSLSLRAPQMAHVEAAAAATSPRPSPTPSRRQLSLKTSDERNLSTPMNKTSEEEPTSLQVCKGGCSHAEVTQREYVNNKAQTSHPLQSLGYVPSSKSLRDTTTTTTRSQDLSLEGPSTHKQTPTRRDTSPTKRETKAITPSLHCSRYTTDTLSRKSQSKILNGKDTTVEEERTRQENKEKREEEQKRQGDVTFLHASPETSRSPVPPGLSWEGKRRWKQDFSRRTTSEVLKGRSPSGEYWKVPSPSRYQWRDRSPSKDGWQERSPSRDGWQERSLSRDEWQERSPSRDEWQERSPSRDEWQERSPSRDGRQERSPSKGERRGRRFATKESIGGSLPRRQTNSSRLPSPSPSCPPTVDEERYVMSCQYQSLPQLHSAPNNGSTRNHTGNLQSDPSFYPYYVGDLYKPFQEMNRGRRHSKTSLIDQALESLEFSPASKIHSQTINVESLSPPTRAKYPKVPSKSHCQEEILDLPLHKNRQEITFDSSSIGTSTGAGRSPILPPLPAGVLDDCPPLPEPSQCEIISEEPKTNLASICILSLDLTVDCEDFINEGFEIINIEENVEGDQEIPDHTSTTENDENSCVADETSTESNNRTKEREDDDTLSVRSSSLSLDEIYYDNDDFEATEESSCDFLSEEEQRQLDRSISLLSSFCDNDTSMKSESKGAVKHNSHIDDDEDFIEIDCDVQPMEAMKRPLVYGYGSGPVRSLQRPSFREKRYSHASDISEYLEMDIAEPYSMGKPDEDIRRKSESCMNLKETYWDYWQAKTGKPHSISNQSLISGSSSRDCSPLPSACPSEKLCYDPEILLAHVRCPKSLEDATFKQYSAYVKSHLYDYFGNVPDTLTGYGLASGPKNWISSQPELLPDSLGHHQPFGNPPLDYSSEPELTYRYQSAKKQGMPSHQYPLRTPPSRRPPPLHKDPSQDSGTWTYLQSSQESKSGFCIPGTYPVPLPRSTSSLSHVGPGSHNPWRHLLPDVTPPRSPRHSVHYSSAVLPESRSASPSTADASLTSDTSKTSTLYHQTANHQQEPRQPLTPKQAVPLTNTKRSFLPNLSKVVKSPLRKPMFKSKTPEMEDCLDLVPELPAVHPSLQKRTNTTTSSKSSSSSSSSSSASSKESVITIIPASARNKGANWLMRHFGGARSKMTAV